MHVIRSEKPPVKKSFFYKNRVSGAGSHVSQAQGSTERHGSRFGVLIAASVGILDPPGPAHKPG